MTTPGNFKKEDLIYWAGLFDGEGCVKVIKINRSIKDSELRSNKRAWRGQIEICGSHYPTMFEFHNLFGGTIYCVNADKEGWLPLYRVTMLQKQAENFVKVVFPYLKIKKEQAINFLAFRKTFKHNYCGSKPLHKRIENRRWKMFDLARTLKREAWKPVTTEREKTCINMKGLIPIRVMPQSELAGILTAREKLEAVSPSN